MSKQTDWSSKRSHQKTRRESARCLHNFRHGNVVYITLAEANARLQYTEYTDWLTHGRLHT